MWIVADEDKYVASTWGAVVRLKAKEPKEVGHELGILCLQNGCTEVKRARNDKGQLQADDPSTPEVNEAYDGGVAPTKKKKAPTKKKVVAKK